MLKLSTQNCTECKICQQICSLEHYGYHAPKRARIHINADWPKKPNINICIACSKKECIKACPQNALEWDGWVKVDTVLCDSCGLCVEACQTNGIYLDKKSQKPLICDTCKGQYLCVQWCPTQAIKKRSTS